MHIDIGVILVELIHTVMHVAPKEIGVATGLFCVELDFPAGDALEGYKHLILELRAIFAIIDVVIVELVGVDIPAFIFFMLDYAVNDHQILGGETNSIETCCICSVDNGDIIVNNWSRCVGRQESIGEINSAISFP
jgi:hypothetical protein